MSPEQTTNLQAIEGIEAERVLFQRVFGTPDGLEVLAWIANECGAWSQEPSKAIPELVAFYNRLLGKLGAIHARNLFTLAEKTFEAANTDDLAEARRRITGQ
jgi:hypothetical protein